MCPRVRSQDDILGLFQKGQRNAFGELDRQRKPVRGNLKSEEINPTSLMVRLRGVNLVVRMRFAFVGIQKVGMHQRDRIPVIIALMGVKHRRCDQCHKHCDHTQTCAKPLHIGDSYVVFPSSQPPSVLLRSGTPEYETHFCPFDRIFLSTGPHRWVTPIQFVTPDVVH